MDSWRRAELPQGKMWSTEIFGVPVMADPAMFSPYLCRKALAISPDSFFKAFT